MKNMYNEEAMVYTLTITYAHTLGKLIDNITMQIGGILDNIISHYTLGSPTHSGRL